MDRRAITANYLRTRKVGQERTRAHQGCVARLAVEQLEGEVGHLQLQLALTLALHTHHCTRQPNSVM